LSTKDTETALLALRLGVTEFRFCTMSKFSNEAEILIADTKKQAIEEGYPESAILTLSGDELLKDGV